MAWNCTLSEVSRAGAEAAINALTSASVGFTDLLGAAAPEFAAQLAAAQSMAIAGLAGLTNETAGSVTVILAGRGSGLGLVDIAHQTAGEVSARVFEVF